MGVNGGFYLCIKMAVCWEKICVRKYFSIGKMNRHRHDYLHQY